MAPWRDPLDAFAWRLRACLRWSAPAWKIRAGRWTVLLEELPTAARDRAHALLERYDLARWPSLLNRLELHEALYTLDVLDRLLPRDLTAGPGLDVGSKNGSLLPALHAAAPRAWTMVELDAHRRYANLSTRRAHGEAMARAFSGCDYVAGSVTEVGGAYAVVTWILPFVHETPLRAWGLPMRFFEPARLLAHVRDRVAPGGALLVINQGEKERDTQRRLFAEAGMDARDLGRVESPLSPFRRERYAHLWRA